MIINNTLTKTRFEFEVLQDVNFSRLRSFLGEVAPLYPNFDAWFNFKFCRNLASGQRKVAIAHDGNQILGAALLKKDAHESKICTFYISPEYRGLSIGDELMDLALVTLNDSDTIITVCSERKDELTPLLSSHGFEVISSHDGLYRDLSTEYVFNL